MSVSAYEHHEFMEFVKDQWGPEKAKTMMNLLPAAGWADVATKDDLYALEASLGGEISELRSEMGAIEARLSSQNSNNMRLLFLGMIGSNATLASLVLAAVQLG